MKFTIIAIHPKDGSHEVIESGVPVEEIHGSGVIDRLVQLGFRIEYRPEGDVEGFLAAMKLAGFELQGTGGGCTTLIREFGPSFAACITDENSRAPESFADQVWLTCYDNGEVLYEQREASVASALLRAGEWLVSPPKPEGKVYCYECRGIGESRGKRCDRCGGSGEER